MNTKPKTQSLRLALTAREVAESLGLSVRTIWMLHATARVPNPFRVGRSVRWRAADIERWIQLGCPSREEFEATTVVEVQG